MLASIALPAGAATVSRSLSCPASLIIRCLSSKIGSRAPPTPALPPTISIPTDTLSPDPAPNVSPPPPPPPHSSSPTHSPSAQPGPGFLSKLAGVTTAGYTPAGHRTSTNLLFNPSLTTNGTQDTMDQGYYATQRYLNSPLSQINPYILHVNASFNNTLVTLTNSNGDAVATSSGGKVGYKKAQRAGYEPAFQATKQVLNKLEAKLGDNARSVGLHVKLKWFGPGRDAAWKCVLADGWMVKMVEDVTPVAHGGCRPRKARRL